MDEIHVVEEKDARKTWRRGLGDGGTSRRTIGRKEKWKEVGMECIMTGGRKDG